MIAAMARVGCDTAPARGQAQGLCIDAKTNGLALIVQV